jgi:hypothetical protein
MDVRIHPEIDLVLSVKLFELEDELMQINQMSDQIIERQHDIRFGPPRITPLECEMIPEYQELNQQLLSLHQRYHYTTKRIERVKAFRFVIQTFVLAMRNELRLSDLNSIYDARVNFQNALISEEDYFDLTEDKIAEDVRFFLEELEADDDFDHLPFDDENDAP